MVEGVLQLKALTRALCSNQGPCYATRLSRFSMKAPPSVARRESRLPGMHPAAARQASGTQTGLKSVAGMAEAGGRSPPEMTETSDKQRAIDEATVTLGAIIRNMLWRKGSPCGRFAQPARTIRITP